MISPTSSPAIANLAVAAAGVASGGVGAAAQAVAPPKTRRTASAAGPAAATARQAAGAKAPGSLVRATRARAPATATRRVLVPGYAVAGATAATNAELSFLKDPKLSLEDKLMRLLAHLNKETEAQIQKKMEEITGKSAQTPAKRKKGGVLGPVADLAGKAFGPALGAALRAPGVSTALSKLGAPVFAAAATALGAPALAPLIAKMAPPLISALAGAASTATASQSGTTGTGGALSDKEKEFKVMELQRLQSHQNEMFRLVSGIMRANHETRLGVIGNIR
jgi:hypothetical protein